MKKIYEFITKHDDPVYIIADNFKEGICNYYSRIDDKELEEETFYNLVISSDCENSNIIELLEICVQRFNELLEINEYNVTDKNSLM